MAVRHRISANLSPGELPYDITSLVKAAVAGELLLLRADDVGNEVTDPRADVLELPSRSGTLVGGMS